MEERRKNKIEDTRTGGKKEKGNGDENEEREMGMEDKGKKGGKREGRRK